MQWFSQGFDTHEILSNKGFYQNPIYENWFHYKTNNEQGFAICRQSGVITFTYHPEVFIFDQDKLNDLISYNKESVLHDSPLDFEIPDTEKFYIHPHIEEVDYIGQEGVTPIFIGSSESNQFYRSLPEEGIVEITIAKDSHCYILDIDHDLIASPEKGIS